MQKLKYSFPLLFILVILLPKISNSQDRLKVFSGSIYFRDGTSVSFNYLGNLKYVVKTAVRGKVGAQNVEFPFEELKEIHFANKNARYDGSPGSDLTIINEEEERFTLTNCVVWGGFSISGYIAYVYNDPATKTLKVTYASICNNISLIVIGEVGDMKFNPKTGEYFPAMYIYDPFTGEKLIWATRR